MREAEGRRTFTGTGVGRGVVAGPVLRMPEPLAEPSADLFHGDVAQEQARAVRALIDTRADLEARARRAGGHAQDVLEAQAVMADDPALAEDVAARIAAGRTAERAVFEALATVQQVLFNLGEPMAARATDVGDVSQRVIARLLGRPVPGPPDSDEPFVLVAADLAPADAALLDLDLVLALVTSGGSATSHTAILAREQSLIAVVGVAGAEQFEDGEIVLVDAGAGVVTGSPTTREVRSARSTAAARARVSPRSPGELADGTPVQLLANLGSVGAAAGALALGAEGVGLFRTELLFLDRSEAPGVAEQAQRYGELLAAFPGRRVVVRVFDAGADKPLAFLGPDGIEPNPALGVRGLRALLAREQVLRDQLTALTLAQDASDAELWVMAPMVADLPEAAAFVTLAKRLGLRTVGVMIEVPSSALLAAQILGVADFVSIGTNDLTQYTLAADRLLAPLGSYQDAWHPAVLRLVKLVGDAGLASGRSIGVCGEAAADPLLAVVLVGLGATSLSVAPAALGEVRTELRRYTLEAARAMAMDALSAASPAEARAAALA